MKSRTAEARAVRGRGRGFSFVEILFAMMLLGIGFIMVAAMMPVAVMQTQSAVDQTIATQIAKGAAEMLEDVADDRTMPQTADLWMSFSNSSGAPIWAFGDEFAYISYVTNGSKQSEVRDNARLAWLQVKGRMIHEADPRYAWTALFSREYNGTIQKAPSFAQVYIWVTKVRTRDQYTADDVEGIRSNLRPREIDVHLIEGTLNGVPGPDLVQFFPPLSLSSGGIDTREAVAEGTFVLIVDDRQRIPYRSYASGTAQARPGRANGRIYRVGVRRPDKGEHVWELMPGWDMASGMSSGGPGEDLILGTADDNQNIPMSRAPRYVNDERYRAKAFVMGRASVDPANAVEFEGPAQDVALFSTFIAVR